MRTLLALDTNGDGNVDMDEIAQFASVQGLDAATSTAEFSGLDTNGDGVLEASEITVALGPVSPVQDTAGVSTPVVAARVQDAPAVVAVSRVMEPTPATPALQVHHSGAAHGSDSAASIVKDLRDGQSAELEAQQLERKSADLRESAMALARETEEQALQAATAASMNKADELMKKAMEFLELATNAEVEAAKARALSQDESVSATAFMEVANGALADR